MLKFIERLFAQTYQIKVGCAMENVLRVTGYELRVWIHSEIFKLRRKVSQCIRNDEAAMLTALFIKRSVIHTASAPCHFRFFILRLRGIYLHCVGYRLDFSLRSK